MNEMLKRIMEAIYDAYDHHSIYPEDNRREIAIAVLTAMREPTKEMANAPEVDCGEYAVSSALCEIIWEAMIDKALEII